MKKRKLVVKTQKDPVKTFIGGLMIGAITGIVLGGVLTGDYILSQLIK